MLNLYFIIGVVSQRIAYASYQSLFHYWCCFSEDSICLISLYMEMIVHILAPMLAPKWVYVHTSSELLIHC